jgi:hypothetical protein
MQRRAFFASRVVRRQDSPCSTSRALFTTRAEHLHCTPNVAPTKLRKRFPNTRLRHITPWGPETEHSPVPYLDTQLAQDFYFIML